MMQIDIETLIEGLVKGAILARCDGTYLSDDFDDGVVLYEMSGEKLKKFAEEIAENVSSGLRKALT